MTRKYTIEEVKQMSLEKGIKFIDDNYKNARALHWYECPKCQKPTQKYFHDVLGGHILCLKCGQSLPSPTLLTLEIAKERARNVGCEFKDDFYVDIKYRHTFLCSKCKKNTFTRALGDVVRKDRPRNLCLECTEESRYMKQKLSEEKYEEYKKYYKENYHIEIMSNYTEYINSSTKNLVCHCHVCNNIKNMSIQQLNDLISGLGCGCSNISQGERIVLEFLEHNGIDYEFQVRLSNGLFTDFELKLKNGRLLVLEIDGSQHYVYNKMFCQTYEDFLHQQENDKIKDDWYKNNGNIVLRVRYEERCRIKGWKNDDIKNILNDILNGCYGAVKRKESNPEFDIINVARNSPHARKILVYTLDGRFYKEYASVKECENELNINNLSKEHSNKVRCGNFMIRDYEENYPLQIEPYDGKNKKIKVYKNGELLKIFNSLREIAKELQIDRHRVSAYLKSKIKEFEDGYHFEFTY